MKTTRITWLLGLLLLASSCKKGFVELNQDPNISQHALPQTLLAPALTKVVKANMAYNQSINNELMQVHVSIGESEGMVHRYDIRQQISTPPYNNWFLQLNNFRDLYASAQERFRVNQENASKTYMGIALICDAWLTSIITDTFGDIPYSEASRAKEQLFLPQFDRQEAIYTDLFRKLEEANELLALDADLPDDQRVADPVFQGTARKWRQFGNSLFIRLLLRVSGKMPVYSAGKIREMVDTRPVDYPLMSGNEDSAILRWTGTIPYDSPFASERDAAWGAPKMAQFFVNNLKIWGDPRIGKWVSRFTGEYEGIPSGYPIGEIQVGRSTRLAALRTEPLLGNLLNHAELQFMLAEAAARGWIAGPAKDRYETGIVSHMSLWNVAVPANFLQQADIAWNEAEGLDAKLEKIHLQKYYSLFITDLQQWFEYRRTGHPYLPKGGGLTNGGEMPARLNYPVYLYNTNRANVDAAIAVQGADRINTKVWWQTF